ncbi:MULTISPECIES: hypothetical protein [Pseudomonadaceae]|uniref:hypothetical protein n=1 Tax=Pseudomonadaceae TaxID=135621 RepID=UPI0012D3B2A8|nr:hypothetical protein [Stutzerimonas stutzeri]
MIALEVIQSAGLLLSATDELRRFAPQNRVVVRIFRLIFSKIEAERALRSGHIRAIMDRAISAWRQLIQVGRSVGVLIAARV